MPLKTALTTERKPHRVFERSGATNCWNLFTTERKPRRVIERVCSFLVKIPGEIKELALAGLTPARMRFVPYAYPSLPSVCPCDVHFAEYLKQRDIRGKSIFHFGTGGHHLVGVRNSQDGLENDVLGITASPAEHARYVKLLIKNPSLAVYYKVLFADIYTLSAVQLPAFDIVTLFHLGEFYDPSNSHIRHDDAGVLDLFLTRLTPGGRILFYSGSCGIEIAQPIADQAVRAGRMALEENYESLLLYRLTDARGPIR